MAIAILVLGFVMNVAGVAISSSRDLQWLKVTVLGWARESRMAAASRLRAAWSRLRGGKVRPQAISGSASINIATGSWATGFAWNEIPDGLDLGETVKRLQSRTDILLQMCLNESAGRAEAIGQIKAVVSETTESVNARFVDLDARIHDFDVKPAGQRATGALLVICGSVLMFASGFMHV
ncbi:MAG: hypothetical protein HGA39_09340 [Coriobacteriia bacterium]|nr:hypothetical protein [Coriobacteriia bacterium]